MKVCVIGLNSCGMRNLKINQYKDFFTVYGWKVVDSPNEADIIYVWTCGFREDVRQNNLAVIKQMLAEHGKEKVYVMGCLPGIDSRGLNKLELTNVVPWKDDAVLGMRRLKLDKIPLKLYAPQLHKGNEKPYVGKYVQIYISEGCRWNCAYCSEKLAFPTYREFPRERIIRTVVEQTEECKEIVLLGDDTGSYTDFPGLIREIHSAAPDVKIAIQDFNPIYFLKYYTEMVRFIVGGLIVHLQIPYQSASNRILSGMNRPYSRYTLDKIFGKLNELNFTEIDSHILVGFPGETRKDFNESVSFALRYNPKYMLINKFMAMPGMPAFDLPDKVSEETKERRALAAETMFRKAGIICNRG